MKSKIYFIGADGRIKIGRTKNLTSRMASFKTVLPGTLELIGQIDGSHDLEQALHEHLAKFNVAREWFKDCAEVRSLIDGVLRQGPECMGIFPKQRPEKDTAKFIPGPPAPDFRQKLVRLVWPNDALAQLVAFTGEREETCRAWLNGEQEFPRLVRYALSAIMISFLGDRVPDFVAEDREEQARRSA